MNAEQDPPIQPLPQRPKRIRPLLDEINCSCCGSTFRPTKRWQKFCSQSCQSANYDYEHIRVPRTEWEALKKEVEELRALVETKTKTKKGKTT